MIEWDGHTPFGELPRIAAARWGDREALVFKSERYTFADLDARVDAVAKGLIGLGIKPGDKIAIWLNNCPEWVDLMFALAKVGAIQVPVNTRFRTSDVEYLLRQADCSGIITHDISGPIDYLAMVRELVPSAAHGSDRLVATEAFPHLRRIILKAETEHPNTTGWGALLTAGESVSNATLADRAAAVSADDTIFIMYTSGTTGFPKGVMRNHHFLRNLSDRFRTLKSSEADVMLNYLPLFHIFGYSDGPAMSVMAGNRQVLTEMFDPNESLDLIADEKVTICCGFETHLKDLCDAQLTKPRDTASLRAGIFAAGMKSSAPIVRRAADVFPQMETISAYGMTEIGANGALSPLGATLEQRAEASGLPCPGFEIRVLDPKTRQEVPSMTPGEIVLKSYNIMQGYYKRPEETAACYDDQGWFHSGDMGYVRPDGHIRFLGRYKDMLKVGGENVDPMEVEGFLLTHRAVRQVAVVGYPDPRLTEVAVAYVKCDDDVAIDAEDLIEFCRGKIASFRIPRHVIFVDDLPMTSSGKIQKAKLRDQALADIPTR